MDFGKEQELMPGIGAPDPARSDRTVQGLFPQNLSPAALAALFLVPGKNYDPYSQSFVQTKQGDSGRYIVHHDKHGPVGNAMFTFDPKAKDVTIDYIGIAPGKINPGATKDSASYKGNSWAHGVGTGEIKSLLKNLAQTFPEAETVSGLRVSGAKEVANAAGRMPVADQQVKMRLPGAPLGVAQALQKPGFGGTAPPGTSITDLW